MHTDRFTNTIASEFFRWGNPNTYPRDPLPYVQVLDRVQGMTTPSTMHMLNKAVSYLEDGESYLEVGTWRGATLIGALIGNEDKKGYAIDNDVMDEHDGDDRESREVWQENIESEGLSSQAHYIEGTVPEVFASLSLPPIGVYLFDGDKETREAAYKGLAGVVPFLAKKALLFVDDGNETTIRQAIHQFQIRYFPHVQLILDIPTPSNCWASFWNGLMILQWDAEAKL